MMKESISKAKKVDRVKENLNFNNELVVQHNNLIEARYRLSLQEKRLMLFLISQVKPKDNSFKNIEISISELSNIMGLDVTNMYRDMEKVTKSMVGRVLSVRNLDENYLLQVPWIASAKYLYGDGIVRFKISDELAPYLLKIKDQFTVIRISDLMRFKSIYSMRIYELLKQYESLGCRKIALEDLRLSCGIPESRLNIISNFKIKVLEISKREINEKSDILIDFKFIKKSRKVIAIEFLINKNPNYVIDNEVNEKIKKMTFELKTRGRLIEEIKEFGFSNRLIINMIDYLSDKEIEDSIRSVKNQMERGVVLNPKAMLRTALKEKWKPDVFDLKKLSKAKKSS